MPSFSSLFGGAPSQPRGIFDSVTGGGGSDTLQGGNLMDTASGGASSDGGAFGADSPLMMLLGFSGMMHRQEDRRLLNEQRRQEIEIKRRQDEAKVRSANKYYASGQPEIGDAIMSGTLDYSTIFSNRQQDARTASEIQARKEQDAAKVQADIDAAVELDKTQRGQEKYKVDVSIPGQERTAGQQELAGRIQHFPLGISGQRGPMSRMTDLPAPADYTNPELYATRGITGDRTLTQPESRQIVAGINKGDIGASEESINKSREANLTEDVKSWRAAANDPVNPWTEGFTAYQQKVLHKGAPLVDMRQEGSFASEQGKYYSGVVADLQASATSAQDSNTELRVAEHDMSDPKFVSGVAGNAALMWGRVTAALGGDPKGVASIEDFVSSTGRLMLQKMGGKLGAGFSNADRDFTGTLVASLSNTVEGNKQIIQVTRAINDRKILYANMADDYVAEHGQLDAKFMKQLRQYGEDHPIFSEELKKKISPAVTPLPTTLPDVGGKHVDPNTGTTYEVLPAK